MTRKGNFPALRGWGRFEQLARVAVAEGRRTALVANGLRALDAVNRVAGNGIAFAEVVKERR